jgi:hypothetical protein
MMAEQMALKGEDMICIVLGNGTRLSVLERAYKLIEDELTTEWRKTAPPEKPKPTAYITLTDEMIGNGATFQEVNKVSGTFSATGWSREQLACLGVPWPMKKGWRSKLKGKIVPKADYDRFMALRKIR